MKLLALLTALTLTTCTATVPARAWDLDKMNDVIEYTNVSVNNQCSGTIIDGREGLVLTAAHCVSDSYETIEKEIVKEDGSVEKKKFRVLRDAKVIQKMSRFREIVYSVEITAVDKSVDLALLRVRDFGWRAVDVRLACFKPRRGETVYIVGNPMGHYGSVTTGLVSATTATYEDFPELSDPGAEKKPLMQISGGVVGGNSGGAVYNSKGALVGVPVIAYRANEVLGFAVPLSSIRTFLVNNGVTEKTCVP